jgi:hypothetical protein
MKYSVITNYDIKSISSAIEEEKLQFLVFVLDSMGINLDGCFPDPLDPKLVTVDHRTKLRDILEKYNILIVDNKDKTFDIYLEKDKIASWKKHWVELKKDFSEIDPKKKIYVNINLECWSVFEQIKDENNE